MTKVTLNGNGSYSLQSKLNGKLPAAFSAPEADMNTPLRPDAFLMADEDKMDTIEDHFRSIMETLGLDLNDDSLKGTPRRVAKMFVQEIFSGLNPENKPAISLFENKYQYRQILVERNITVKSFCEHHFLPIIGVAHVAYFSAGEVIGLSKLNRIVEYFARRPQVQERLTVQIAAELKRVLNTEDVAVYIDARHMCVELRGVEHSHCSTVTTEYSGKFLNENIRAEFLQTIK
ncbi:MAG: GTP cyclohydrolase I FolE [Saprospiraceae bacterium]|nr:GTP cyclohydrolase I FolE [Saprospiraceae bacterium]